MENEETTEQNKIPEVKQEQEKSKNKKLEEKHIETNTITTPQQQTKRSQRIK